MTGVTSASRRETASHAAPNGKTDGKGMLAEAVTQRIARNEGLLSVEGCAGRAGLLTRNNFEKNGVRLSSGQRALVLRLFESPMAASEARGFFPSTQAMSSIVYRINRAYSRAHGNPAIKILRAHGERTREISWVMQLNPKLFRIRTVRVAVGEDFGWRDALSEGERAAVEFLLSNSLSPLKAVSLALGVPEGVSMRLLTSSSNVNSKLRRLGLPEAIEFTDRFPHLYYISREFAQFFGEDACFAKISREVFSEDELKIMSFLAEHPKTSCNEVCSALRLSRSSLGYKLKSIQEKATLFGLQATCVMRADNIDHYSLSEELSKALNVKTREEDVTRLFADSDLRALRFMVEHPCGSVKEFAKTLGTSHAFAKLKLARLRRKCKKLGVDGIVCVSKVPARCYAKPEFARKCTEKFGWNVKPLQPLDVILGTTKRRVCAYFLEHPEAEVSQAQRDLHLKRHRVLSMREACDKILQAHGFRGFRSLKRVARFKEFDELKRAFVAYRIENGKWPSQYGSRKRGIRALESAVRKIHGGFATVIKRITEDEETVRQVAAGDLEKLRRMIEEGRIDVSRLGEERRRVMASVRTAILNGIEFARVIKVSFEERTPPEERIGTINRLMFPEKR